MLQNRPQLLNRVQIQTERTFEITGFSRSSLLEHSREAETKGFRSSKTPDNPPSSYFVPTCPICLRGCEHLPFSTQDLVIISDIKAAFVGRGDVGMIRNCQDTHEIPSGVICEFNSFIPLNRASGLAATVAGANQKFGLSLKVAL